MQTRAFYEDVLGLGSKHRPEIPGIAGHWFDGSARPSCIWSTRRWVEQGSNRATTTTASRSSDLDAAIAELEARGIEYLRGAQGDVVQIWILDPAGNVIELQQERQP